MGIENLKRWHWIVIGLVLGLVLAYVQIGVGTDGMFAGGKHNSMGQSAFETALHAPPIAGNPSVRNVRVYPDGDKFLVKLEHLEHDQKSNDNKVYKYQDYILTTSVPYAPFTDLSKTVNVGIHPATPSPDGKTPLSQVKVNLAPQAVLAEFRGWSILDGNHADPGAGAEVRLALRPSSYQLRVVAPDATDAQVAGLSIKFNDRALPPLRPATKGQTDAGQPAVEAGVWQTTVPEDAFVHDPQVLHVARQDQPIHIRELRLINPTYTVMDYLRETAPDHKQVAWRFGWWTQPKATLAIWTLGSVLLIGGVWPTVINLLIGAGLGKPPKAQAEYDLNRFRGGPDAQPEKKQAGNQSKSEAEAEDKLAAIEAELERKLAAADEVRKLTGAPPAEAAPSPTAAAKAAEEKKKFAGEFYPVVRNTSDDKPAEPPSRPSR